eukprot:1930956-Amphidinium_carterae.1
MTTSQQQVCKRMQVGHATFMTRGTLVLETACPSLRVVISETPQWTFGLLTFLPSMFLVAVVLCNKRGAIPTYSLYGGRQVVWENLAEPVFHVCETLP